MTRPFSCPSCGHHMDIPDRYAGRELFCTSCKIDNGIYPAGASSIDDLETAISPTYLRSVPQQDGWTHPYQVWITEDGATFVIVSYGRDKIEGTSSGGATRDFDDDIILQDGRFVQWPEGIATQ